MFIDAVIDDPASVWNYLAAVDVFLLDHPYIVPIDIEQPICHPDYRAAGTADLLCTYNDRYWLVDFKSSAEIESYSKYGKRMRRPITKLDDCNLSYYSLQTSMYAQFYNDCYGIADDIHRMIVQFKPDRTYAKYFPPDHRAEAILVLDHHANA